ncbi:MAG: hemolysin family protein, partial [Chloroflexota bacterium]
MQLLFIVVLVLLNGVLAMSEIAIVSARRGRLIEMAENGTSGAKAAIQLADDPNRFLSTVQIGITLVGIFAGAIGGTTVGRQLGAWLAENTALPAGYTQPAGVALIVLFTTYLSLVLGELAPKRVGLQYPEAIAARVAAPMTTLSRLSAPIVWTLSQSTNGVLRLLNVNPNDEPTVSDAEVINLVKEGSSEGVFPSHEVDMVRGVLKLDEKRVADIMTPRPQIRSLDVSGPLDEIKETIIGSPHGFYPVCDGGIDNVLGIIKAKDLLTPLVRNEQIDLNRLMRPPLFIPGVTAASRALEIFKADGNHVAMVVAEHGGVDGLLTLNDVIEEIVGDVDADEPDIVQRENGSWLVDGRVPLERFADFLPEKITPPTDE